MDALKTCLFLVVFSLHPVSTAMLVKGAEHRNLFSERSCCKRQGHFIYVGQDISGSPVSVDVGLCRSTCGGVQRAPNSHGPGLPGYSKHSSMLDYLRSKKVRGRTTPDAAGEVPSCGRSSICEPAGIRVERVLLMEGLREVEVIDECHCELKLEQCVRMPALKTYLFETPYETVVDVGKCSSSTEFPEGFSCVPVKFDSALVETPDKLDLIRTLSACELRESCYRVPYIEYHYEVVHSSNGVKEEKIKEIDIGRCLGSCAAGNRCLLRSTTNPEQCLMWEKATSSSCVPLGYQNHVFRSRQGHIRNILAISSCQCQQ
ncbi:uncharacterized protein im:7138239 isoform X1 [Anguilla anguilla]|uniref:uncharacterized protein im:7138239 isoform X1 n=2 Tax=Anguilla anguilla TaxID=7936 RepID=UPI0015B1117B|nr:uncharacterized protein im:7138239 isoform X1 [Anguilla anguilla]